MDFIEIVLLIVVISCMLSRKDVFRVSRISCSYLNWMGGNGKLLLTCQLAGAPLSVEEHVECTYDNCPLVHSHMKGKVKNPSDRYNEITPLTEGDTLGAAKPHKSAAAEPIGPPPAPKPKEE